MRYATLALLVAVASAAEEQPLETTNDAVRFVEGVLVGALDAEFPHLEQCIDDGRLILLDVENAYRDFKSHSVHDVIEGLKAVGDAFRKTKAAVSDCKQIAGDWSKLETIAIAFSTPESAVIHIGKDIILHGRSIWREIQGAIHAYEASPRDYFGFGKNIGLAGAQILLGSTDENTFQSAAENMYLY